MGSVTVMGTSTMSTFMRISAPGRALAAAGPVTAGGCAPAGAPVAGVAAGGGVTWTLLRGSSCAPTRSAETSTDRSRSSTETASQTPPGCRRLPCSSSRRLGCFRIVGFLRLIAILARLAKRWRHGCVIGLSTRNQLMRRRQEGYVTGIQSSLCAGRDGSSSGVRSPAQIQPLQRGARPTLATIYPFRAWRYNPSTVRLEDVVTQPYDKISPAMQQAYYQRSPYNLVRIILGLPELFDAERGESVYTRAARDLKAWREQGVLTQEHTPCVFAYAQRFEVPGSTQVKERRGFIALGKLHDYSEQVVFRHEQTLSKPKSDRLNLLKATHAHFGQIFMLYSDPAGSVEKILYEGSGSADAEVTDEYGVLHRLWRVSDPAAIRLLSAAMADKKLIIADGHHRYETALNYSKEHAPGATAKNEH